MRAPRFVIPPLNDEAWLCHVRSAVKQATYAAVYNGRAISLRDMHGRVMWQPS